MLLLFLTFCCSAFVCALECCSFCWNMEEEVGMGSFVPNMTAAAAAEAARDRRRETTNATSARTSLRCEFSLYSCVRESPCVVARVCLLSVTRAVGLSRARASRCLRLKGAMTA